MGSEMCIRDRLHSIRSEPDLGRLGKPQWRLRGALFLRLQHIKSGIEFYFGTVHLKCCDSGKEIRAHQAKLLAEWIKKTDVPVIIAGDFNIPIEPDEVDSFNKSEAFKSLESATSWIRPINPVTTQCDDRFESMLDHVFFKDGPNIIMSDTEIMEPQSDYCALDEKGYADHRPVKGTFKIQP